MPDCPAAGCAECYILLLFYGQVPLLGLQELDFEVEAANAERCRRNLASPRSAVRSPCSSSHGGAHPGSVAEQACNQHPAALQVRGRVHVPVILPHFTTKHVLTMELIEHACDVCDVAAMQHMGVRPADVAKLVRPLPCFRMHRSCFPMRSPSGLHAAGVADLCGHDIHAWVCARRPAREQPDGERPAQASDARVMCSALPSSAAAEAWPGFAGPHRPERPRAAGAVGPRPVQARAPGLLVLFWRLITSSVLHMALTRPCPQQGADGRLQVRSAPALVDVFVQCVPAAGAGQRGAGSAWHGLRAHRVEYAGLWSALIFGDEAGIKRHAAAMNAADSVSLFAGMLTMRPWDEVTRCAVALAVTVQALQQYAGLCARTLSPWLPVSSRLLQAHGGPPDAAGHGGGAREDPCQRLRVRAADLGAAAAHAARDAAAAEDERLPEDHRHLPGPGAQECTHGGPVASCAVLRCRARLAMPCSACRVRLPVSNPRQTRARGCARVQGAKSFTVTARSALRAIAEQRRAHRPGLRSWAAGWTDWARVEARLSAFAVLSWLAQLRQRYIGPAALA